jgi:phosphate starvation-inducible PhoH-like protein
LTLDHPLTEVVLEFPDNRLLIDLCGPYDSHLTAVEKALEVQIVRRGNVLSILGDEASQSRASSALHALGYFGDNSRNESR